MLGLSGAVTGTRFEVSLAWTTLKFILYSSSEITFTVSGATLEATGKFSGSLRAAGYWSGGDLAGGDVATLDTHAGRIPRGGRLSATVQSDTATLQFQWRVEGEGELLMMALPHQQETLTNPSTPHTGRVLKGRLVGYTGDIWTFLEPLTTIAWTSTRPLPTAKVASVRTALAEDVASTGCCSDDPYFGGKQMAKLARLALIAEELGEVALAKEARDRVKPVLEGWLAGTNGDRLLYDQTWGGVVSINGLSNQHADFGNGMYNDHHFHYGYHIYTAAVVAKAEPDWGDTWAEAVLHLISDVAEPSRSSRY